LPQFVLINTTGKIAFATTGVDEKEIRAGLAQLGFDIGTSVRQGRYTK
jgi:hypothetical protein